MERYIPVDYNDYADTTERLVAKYREQMPDRGGWGFDDAIEGGEHSFAAEDLVFHLVEHQITVTAEDAADLRRLWFGTTREHSPEDMIDRLVIVG
jgi:hypothetical protein